jgi:hypothetical protein
MQVKKWLDLIYPIGSILHCNIFGFNYVIILLWNFLSYKNILYLIIISCAALLAKYKLKESSFYLEISQI